LKRSIYTLTLVLLLIAGVGLGQTALDSTTLGEAVDGTETRIDVASSSNAAVGEIAVVDKEAMRITAVATGRITVTRGYAGTKADNHATGSLIYINPANRYVQNELFGPCTAASEYPAYTPLIVLPSGNRYTCTGSVWRQVDILGSIELVETLAAVDTLTTSECGKTVFLNHATEFAVTLPAPSAGCKFTFFVAAAPVSASYTVVTAASANLFIGGINELEVDTGDDGPYDADGDTITFVDGVSVVGDHVTLISDGTSWFISGQANADGGITVTKAS